MRQHTHCGIEDADTVPPLFVCSGCCVSPVPPRIEPCSGSTALMLFPFVAESQRLNKDWGVGRGTNAN